jgi:beta-phosphoglucomutase
VRGVLAFVDALAARSVPCAVATSASRYDADRLLGRTGLRDRFDIVVTAEDVRRGKPDPEVYLRAAGGLGISPGECLVFEDAVVGVQAARSAGMRVIGVSTAHTETELLAAGAERAIEHFEGVTWPA